MSDRPITPNSSQTKLSQEVVISEEALQKAEEFIEAEEGAANKLR